MCQLTLAGLEATALCWHGFTLQSANLYILFVITDLKLSLPLHVLVPMAFQTLQSKPLHLPLCF